MEAVAPSEASEEESARVLAWKGLNDCRLELGAVRAEHAAVRIDGVSLRLYLGQSGKIRVHLDDGKALASIAGAERPKPQVLKTKLEVNRPEDLFLVLQKGEVLAVRAAQLDPKLAQRR